MIETMAEVEQVGYGACDSITGGSAAGSSGAFDDPATWQVIALSHWPCTDTKGVNATLTLLDRNAVFADLHYVHLNDPPAVRRARSVIAPTRVVLVNGYKAMIHPNGVSLLKRAAALGCRLVLYWHETDWALERMAHDFPIGARRFHVVLQRFPKACVTHWSAGAPVSYALQRRFHVTPARLRQVFNVIDVDALQPMGPRHPQRACLTLGAAGRTVPLKGIAFMAGLSESFRELAGREVEIHWIGGGEPPGLPPHRLVFEGFRTDFAERLRALDALVVPSFHEAFSLVGAEALALDKPVFCRWPVGLAAFLPEAFVFASRGELEAKLDAYFRAPAAYPAGFFRSIAESFTVDAFARRAAQAVDPVPDTPPPATTLALRLRGLGRDLLAQVPSMALRLSPYSRRVGGCAGLVEWWSSARSRKPSGPDWPTH